MTTDPHPDGDRDMSTRVDVEALFENAPVITDPSDLASPEIFETDEELDDFLAWYRAERQTSVT